MFDVPRGAFTVRAQNPRNSEIVAAGDGAVANHGEEVELRLVVPVDEPPQVVVAAPVAGAAVLEGTVVTIRAEAVDDFGVRRVEFYADGVAIGADETAPYAVDYVMPQGDGGAVAVTAVAVDGGQNRTTSAVVSVVRRDDAQLPTVRFTAPFEGAAFIEGTTVDVAVNAADDVAVARVEFLADGAPIGVVAEPPYAVRYAVPVGRPGALTLAAVVVDGAGNRVEAQRVITVVDDAPPVLRVVEVPARVVEGQPVRVVAEVVDEGEVTVDLLAPGGGGAGAVRVVETRTRPPYRFEQTAPPAASVGGIWNLTVRARDTQDQVSQQEIPIEVVVDAPPVVRILAPGVGAVGTEGATVAVTAEAEDELGVAEVRFFVDGVQRAARLAPPFTADLQIPAGDDGAPVAFRVEAVDTGGQVGQAQVEVTRRDDAAPPTGRITSPEAGSTLTVGPSDVMILLARDTRAGPIADIGFGGDGRAAQVAVARALVARFDPATTRIGVADYADAALTRQAITGDFALVDAAFAAFVARGAAGAPDLGDAIDEALRRLVRAPARRAAAPVVYLFSLGGGAVPVAALERAVAAGLVVHTVGFGGGRSGPGPDRRGDGRRLHPPRRAGRAHGARPRRADRRGGAGGHRRRERRRRRAAGDGERDRQRDRDRGGGRSCAVQHDHRPAPARRPHRADFGRLGRGLRRRRDASGAGRGHGAAGRHRAGHRRGGPRGGRGGRSRRVERSLLRPGGRAQHGAVRRCGRAGDRRDQDRAGRRGPARGWRRHHGRSRRSAVVADRVRARQRP
ncbi:MAG: Ig-like domain-containing protein [bacterium]